MFRRDKWWIREIERINRAHEAREADLVATIARLAGKPHPSEAPLIPKRKDPDEGFRTWTASPEQQPLN